ncbi:hypothetical protein B566_EDAN000944 [Ephemera danica]|nr:hypothetical protein B566_EDAN000944 [Ephemera danica]
MRLYYSHKLSLNSSYVHCNYYNFLFSVWVSIFIPAAEFKSYTRLVVETLSQMFAVASARKDDSSLKSRLPCDKHWNYLSIINCSLTKYSVVSNEVVTLYSNFQIKQSLAQLIQENPEMLDVWMTEYKEKRRELLETREDMRTKGGFPWKTANFLLIVAITGLAAYDINKHGTSSTGHFLKETGVLHYGQIACDYFAEGPIYKWGKETLPPLWAQYGSPAWKVVRDLSHKAVTVVQAWALNLGNWATETWPIVVDFIEKYAPGLLDKCQEFGWTAWGYTKHYSELGYGHAKNASISAITWVNTNVLVGQLSPENLSRVSLQAYNATQTFAIDTYQWISEKVLPSTTKNA